MELRSGEQGDRRQDRAHAQELVDRRLRLRKEGEVLAGTSPTAGSQSSGPILNATATTWRSRRSRSCTRAQADQVGRPADARTPDGVQLRAPARATSTSPGRSTSRERMRLATAADEILPLRDPRVNANQAYLVIILLSRVVTGSAAWRRAASIRASSRACSRRTSPTSRTVSPRQRERHTRVAATCPSCATRRARPGVGRTGESLATPSNSSTRR